MHSTMTIKSPRKEYLYLLQIAFAALVSIGCSDVGINNIVNWKSLERIARFLIYMGTADIAEEIIQSVLSTVQRGMPNITQTLHKCRANLALLAASVSVLLSFGRTLYETDFLFLTMARLLKKYVDRAITHADAAAAAGTSRTIISYGSGMACSFFEGYLRKVIPPDESQYDGFQGAIRNYECNEHVHFPVKRLFLIITKSLHCPPNLAFFNKEHRPELPRLEACKSLEDVTRNVAGVQRRVYRNSAYQIQRQGSPPVYLVVECASPLHTLHRVVTNKALYDELLHADPDEIRADFCDMLSKILQKSVDCRHKCELVYYDDTDPEQNLSDLLLQRIQLLEPRFERLILEAQRRWSTLMTPEPLSRHFY